jgi:Sec-independent protein secretion pathway component TatC
MGNPQDTYTSVLLKMLGWAIGWFTFGSAIGYFILGPVFEKFWKP